MMEWVLAQGPNAVPVSPQWFVDDWSARVRRMYARIKDAAKRNCAPEESSSPEEDAAPDQGC